jgi:hypothetical protein
MKDCKASAESPLSRLQAFEQQATPEMMTQLRRYAQARAKKVRRAGRPVSETYARELVDDVYADTRIGDLPWDPRCGLLEHLTKAIKKRTWLEIRHAHRVPFVSLEAANDVGMALQIERAFAQGARSDCNPIMLHAITSAVCQQLRPLVSCDVDAHAVVSCWAAGFMEKDEVIALTGLSDAAYKSARKRLYYFARSLRPELRDAARDLLRSATNDNAADLVTWSPGVAQ